MQTNLEFLPPLGAPQSAVWSDKMASLARHHRILVVVVVGIVLAIGRPAAAERKEPIPDDLQEVGVTELLNDKIPLDLEFVNYAGNKVKLGDYFNDDIPVILTLNYSSCPMLCSMQLDGLFDGLKAMKWDLGDKYRMVTVSIDPSEPPERSAMTREKYLRRYGRAGSGDGYACLVGKNKQIKALADAVGFHYRYVPENGEYAHTAATMICTPDGRMSRYLYGVEYDPQTLRMSLLEASQGKIGTPVEQLLLFCFQYDATSGRYGPSALALMKLGAIATVLVVGGVLLVYWRKERSEPPTVGEEPNDVENTVKVS